MTFTEPLPFAAALKRLAAKEDMPTDLSSAELRGIEAEVRERALFSARTTNAGYLQRVRDVLGKLLNGETNMATSRAVLQDELDGLGYDPAAGGFEGEEVEPAEEGSLRDLSSDGRLKLMLETNMRQVANFAYRKVGGTDAALFQFPAWELVRLYPRTVERGEKVGKGGAIVPDPGNDWLSRWEKAGGELFDGRMIARKDSEVWEQLGSSENFDDALDAAYPPFAFNSGMGWRQVSRAECIDLGVIEEGDEVSGLGEAGLEEQLGEGSDLDADFLRELRSEISNRKDAKTQSGSGNSVALAALLCAVEERIAA